MTDRKIIDRKHVKENNPNDDEEILKNMEGVSKEDTKEKNETESTNKEEKSQDAEPTEFPGSM